MAAILLSAGFAASAHGSVLVSLGDSYSSGEGAAPYDADTDRKGDHKCHRSPSAWPRLVGVSQDHHRACSGAVIGNLEDGGASQTHSPPDNVSQMDQLEEIAGETRIDRVLVTVGGNDPPVNFAKRLKSCVVAICLRDADKIVRELPQLGERLKATYERIKEVSGAPVLVVGYPDLFPDPGSRITRCGWMTQGALRRFDKIAAKLEQTIAGAANAAGVEYLSMRTVLNRHELCSKEPWIRDLIRKPGDLLGDQQQGHPTLAGQQEMALRVLKWLIAHRPQCTATGEVAAVVDDSGSMSDNDPDNIRRHALELLLTKPANQGRTFGAVEFGGDAGTLFSPGIVGPNLQSMVDSLGALQNDGYGGEDSTDYNAAFAETNVLQPNAGARIFLTDGGHNDGPYEDGHAGGRPTYVIGLNFGPGDEDSQTGAGRLQRIASETGGRYFPLKLSEDDSIELQLSRLQPALNEIDASLGCAAAQGGDTLTLDQPGRASPSVNSVFGSAQGMEIVVSWPDPDADVDVSSLVAYDKKGQVIADLQGKKRIGKSKKKRKKLATSTVEGQTFDTVTVGRPAAGRTLGVKVSAPALPSPVPVTIQLRPVANGPAGSGTSGVPEGGAPPPTATNFTAVNRGSNQVDVALDAGWAPGRDPVTCHIFRDGAEVLAEPCGAHYERRLTGEPGGGHAYHATVSDAGGATSTPSARVGVEVTGPPTRVNAYDNYGPGAAGHSMCRGNPARGESMPGGTVTQSFTVPPGVASLDHALVQIDPDNRVVGHLSLFVNGVHSASADAAAAGDTHFSFAAVPVKPDDTVKLSINFTASFGKIITVYTVGPGRGTFTTSNSCPDGAENSTRTDTALRAVLSGWTP